MTPGWTLHGGQDTVKPHWSIAILPQAAPGCWEGPDARRRWSWGGRPAVAGTLAGLHLLALLLASSPAWHRSFHDTDSHPDHQCLATLLDHGLLEAASAVCAAPEPVLHVTTQFPARLTLVSTPGLDLPPSRGPPA